MSGDFIDFAELAKANAECERLRKEQDVIDKAKYEAVQRWREESGSKERFKGRPLREEYLAQLSDVERKRLLGSYEDGVYEFPDPIDCAMHADNWIYPTVHEFL